MFSKFVAERAQRELNITKIAKNRNFCKIFNLSEKL